MILRLCAVSLLLFVFGLFVSAEPLEKKSLSFLSLDDQNALLTDGNVKVFADRFDALKLWRGSPFEAALKPLFSPRKSTLAAEAMFLIPVTLPKDPSERNDKLARAMTSVSTMTGLQVYSVSLKRMETFIFEAFRTSTTDKKARLPDPESASASTSFTMFQREEQTGESFSRYTFSRESAWLQVTQTNLTSLNYGIVPLVSPGDLLTTVCVVPYDDKLLVYGVTVAKTFSFFGIERSKTTSLYMRMEALVTWLTNNLRATPGN